MTNVSYYSSTSSSSSSSSRSSSSSSSSSSTSSTSTWTSLQSGVFPPPLEMGGRCVCVGGGGVLVSAHFIGPAVHFSST